MLAALGMMCLHSSTLPLLLQIKAWSLIAAPRPPDLASSVPAYTATHQFPPVPPVSGPDRGRMRHHIRQSEVPSLEQERRPHDRRNSIGQTVAEVQLRRMPACPAEACERLGGRVRHLAAERDDRNRPGFDELLQPARRARREIDRAP